jgi:hypothetical protein
MIRGRGPNFTAASDMVLAGAEIGAVLGNAATPRMNALGRVPWIFVAGSCRSVRCLTD